MGELGITDITSLTPTEKQATVRELLQARSGVYPSSDLVFVHRVQTETEYEFDQQNLDKIIGQVFGTLEPSEPMD